MFFFCFAQIDSHHYPVNKRIAFEFYLKIFILFVKFIVTTDDYRFIWRILVTLSTRSPVGDAEPTEPVYKVILNPMKQIC